MLVNPSSYYKLGTDGISEENGFWRTFSFGMLAMEKVSAFIHSKNSHVTFYLEYL